MKTSIITAAIRCAVAGRNAVREGKIGMGRLVRTSHLSLLYRPVFCSIQAGYPWSFSSMSTAKTSASRAGTEGLSSQTMHKQDRWQQDDDSRVAGNHNIMNVMPIQKTRTLKACALA